MLSILNVCLYLILFLYYKKKYHNIACTIIPFMWLFSAVGCAYMSFLEPKRWDLSFFPFIYLFVVSCILLFPIRYLYSATNATTNMRIGKPIITKVLVYSYMLFALESIWLTIQKAIINFQTGEWLAAREAMSQHEEEAYSNFFERLSLNGVGFLSLLAEVYLFYLLSSFNKKKTNKIFLIFLALCVYLPPIVTALANAARGSLFFMLLNTIVIFYIFKRNLPKRLVKIIYIIAGIVAVLFLLLSIAITISRFDSDASSSVIYYFGHAMNNFNYGVMDTINSYSGGKWFFGQYYDAIVGHYVDFSPDNYQHTHVGSEFITLVGCLLIDFGPFFTIIVSLLIALVFIQSRGNGVPDLSNAYLYAIYASLLLNGTFVLGYTYGTKLIVKLIIYYIIRPRNVSVSTIPKTKQLYAA